jgi:hypothetical protein
MKKIIHELLKYFRKKVIDINTAPVELKKLINKIQAIKTEYELVRIGSTSDGGYLLPNDFENIEAVFSPGVSNIHSFELHMLEKYKVKSFMCDFTVDKIIPNKKELIFEKKHLGVINNHEFQRLEEWVNLNSKTKNLILQMDIEGAEYSVILDTPIEILKKFRIIIIEFHDLDLSFNTQFFEIYSSVINKILKQFSVVHLHPNNCCGTFKHKNIEIPKVLEITFINNDRLSKPKYQKVIDRRHLLDIDNNSKLPTLEIPKSWYKNEN